jgi:hypothetical protein
LADAEETTGGTAMNNNTVVSAQPGFEVGFLDRKDYTVVTRWLSVIAWSIRESSSRDDLRVEKHIDVDPITMEGIPGDGEFIVKDPNGRIDCLGICYCDSMEEYVEVMKREMAPLRATKEAAE